VAARHQDPVPFGGLWIDAGEGAASEDARGRPPQIPDGSFLHWLFVNDWNRFIHLCGRRAALRWVEQQPVRMRGREAVSRSSAGSGAPGDLLQKFVGHGLSAVTFARDHVQLQFDGLSMKVLTPIVVHSDAAATRSGDETFRNVVCRQVGKQVAGVLVSRWNVPWRTPPRAARCTTACTGCQEAP
jgi:hypothetical protein